MLTVDLDEKIIKGDVSTYLTEIIDSLKPSLENIRIKNNFKVIVVGDGAVGKTTLVKRYLGKPFHAQYLVTLGIQTSVVKINLEKIIGVNREISLQLWDLAGQPSFREVVKAYYKGVDATIFVGDLTRLPSFESATKWLHDINKYNMKKTPFIIVGSKYDLIEPNLPINDISESLKSIKKAMSGSIYGDLLFIETSSKSNLNVNEVFILSLLRDIYFYNYRRVK